MMKINGILSQSSTCPSLGLKTGTDFIKVLTNSVNTYQEESEKAISALEILLGHTRLQPL